MSGKDSHRISRFYLLSERHWAEDQIGLVMSIAMVSGLIVQTPAGALIDTSHAKRGIIAAAALVVASAAIVSPFISSFTFQAGSQAAAGAADTFFGPAIAAITLGIMGPGAFTRRIGRNEAFNHAGNAFAAVLAAIFASLWGPAAVFYFIAGMALLSIVGVLAIPKDAIDHERARALRDGAAESLLHASSSHNCGPHTRNRPFQFGPRSRDHGAEHWCSTQHFLGRSHCRLRGLFHGLPNLGGHSGFWLWFVFCRHA
jgi:MFS family permease